MRPRGTCCRLLVLRCTQACLIPLWVCLLIVLWISILTYPVVDPEDLHQKIPFKLTDGDLVNCTPIGYLVEKLPTPNTSWRVAPTMLPVDHYLGNLSTDIPTVHSARIRQATQLIVTEQQTCPQGTVPIRSTPVPSWFYQSVDHKYAAVHLVAPLRGSQGRLSIWRPYVQENAYDFSLAQVWVASYDFKERFHALEAGWQIWKYYYGDSKPRLFVYWTTNKYQEGFGCYNLICPGFIQVSNKWLLGGSFTEISSFDSLYEFEIKIHIFKDAWTGDWWLQLNDENVGYWPQNLFGLGAFSDSKNVTIAWGGEVMMHRHWQFTNTQMGSGNHPDFSETRRVAYMRNLRVVNHKYRLDDPAPMSRYTYTKSTFKQCYDIIVHDQSSGAGKNQSLGYNERSTWGTYAYFGGPGLNAECLTKPRK